MSHLFWKETKKTAVSEGVEPTPEWVCCDITKVWFPHLQILAISLYDKQSEKQEKETAFSHLCGVHWQDRDTVHCASNRAVVISFWKHFLSFGSVIKLNQRCFCCAHTVIREALWWKNDFFSSLMYFCVTGMPISSPIMKNDNLRVSRSADFIRATELKCAVWVFRLSQVELIITVTPLQASFLF